MFVCAYLTLDVYKVSFALDIFRPREVQSSPYSFCPSFFSKLLGQGLFLLQGFLLSFLQDFLKALPFPAIFCIVDVKNQLLLIDL